MMKTYARIDSGIVAEIIVIGEDMDINEMFTAEIVQTLVDVTSIDPAPQEHWRYDGVVFTAT